MGKNRNKRNQPSVSKDSTPQQQGAVMSQQDPNHKKISDAQKVNDNSMTPTERQETKEDAQATFSQLNPDPKGNAPASPDQKKGDEAKTQVVAGGKETKEGVIKVVTGLPSLAWNKAIKPAYEFIKGIVTRAWNGLVNMYHAEVAAFKELGAKKYFLGRGGKLGIKLFKILGAAAVVSFINNLLFNATGISLFDPMTLSIIAVVALVCVVGSSYYAQKDVGAEFKAGVTGQHITEAFLAA